MTTDMIATVMRYERPSLTTSVYPHNVEGGRTLTDYVGLTYEDPTTFKGTTLVGGLKHSYGVMNKVLHYNLMPRGLEKNPTIENLVLLHAFMIGVELMFHI